ncbi:MAG: phosphatidate cytidylyltransferase [Dysgonamonadaceae bacterium]|jgi:phosphatidate cytidylyltransferase|nr:phosphatidate cytidylyltransferase [Dysgonamonadaceae bacterium]
MKNFFLRLLTGTVYVALVVSSILLNQYTFSGFFAAIVFLCLWEFYSLINTHKKVRINYWYNGFGGLLLFISVYLCVSGIYSYVILFPYLLYIVTVWVSELHEKQEDPVSHVSYIFAGQCYIALPLSLLNLLAFPDDTSKSYYSLFLLSLFVFIWISDTGAYLTGMFFGRHRLFPRISPKKTWEGLFGGLFFTVASSFIFAYFAPEIALYHWIIISILVVLFGALGDLIESLIKRTLDIKDSGHALPGHGGFLDRFDSLFLATYAMIFYVKLFII